MYALCKGTFYCYKQEVSRQYITAHAERIAIYFWSPSCRHTEKTQKTCNSP